MSTSAKQVTGAVAAALVVWALLGLLAGVITAALGLIAVLVMNRDSDTGGAARSASGFPAAYPGDRALWKCPGCDRTAGVLIPLGTPAGVHAAACGVCGRETKVEVRDSDCPKGHMIGAHGRCAHCGFTPQTVTA